MVKLQLCKEVKGIILPSEINFVWKPEAVISDALNTFKTPENVS